MENIRTLNLRLGITAQL